MPANVKRPGITLRVATSMIWRALTLRCPHCGGRGVLASWFRLQERCPRCRLHLHREEGDYFLGAYVIMLITMELVFAIGLLVALIATWPNPPWEAIQWVGAGVLLAGILIAYPFAKTLWLAIDLMFRPVSAKELGWYSKDPAVTEEDNRR